MMREENNETGIHYLVPRMFDVDEFALSVLVEKSRVTYGVKNKRNGNDKSHIKLNRIKEFTLYFLDRMTRADYQFNSIGDQHYCLNLRSKYRDYATVIKELKKQGVIKSSGVYSYGSLSYCKSYGLTKKYRNDYKKVYLKETDWRSCLEKLLSEKNYKKDKSHTREEVLEYNLKVFREELEINAPDWWTYFNNRDISVSKVEAIVEGIESLKRCIFNIKRSGVGNRVYSTLTRLPKEARQFIHHKKYGSMYGVDISCSHLTILCGVMGFDKNTLPSLLSQDFYTAIGDGKASRDDMKKNFMYYLYGSNWCCSKSGNNFKRNTPLDKQMKVKLPELHEYISDLSKDSKKELSHILMELESELITVEAGSRLMDTGIPFYTVHDAIYVPGDFVDVTKKIIADVFESNVAITPRVKVGVSVF